MGLQPVRYPFLQTISTGRSLPVTDRILPEPLLTCFLLIDYCQEGGTPNMESDRYLGTVKVNFNSLQFIDGREIDPAIVAKLKRVYTKNECRRYDPENFIQALVSASQLRKALRASGFSQGSLKAPSQDGSFKSLQFPHEEKVNCLDGRHRIQAGKEFLPSNDQWWTIVLVLLRPNGMIIGLRWS